MEQKPLGWCLNKCNTDCTKDVSEMGSEEGSEEIGSEEGSEEHPTGYTYVFQSLHFLGSCRGVILVIIKSL